MAKTTASDTDFVEFLVALRDLIDARLDGKAPAAPVDDAPAKGKGKTKADKPKPAPEPEPEPDEDEGDEDPYAEYRTELEGKSLKALRALAIKAGFDKAEVQDADEESIIESLIADRQEAESADADDAADADEDADDDADDADDDDADDEAEDEESDEYTREDFEGLSLKELRKIAKDEYELSAADIKGLDKDGLIDYLLGDEEADEDEDDEADDDEEETGYTEEDLADMSLAELKALAKEWEVPVRAGSKSKTIIKDLLAAFEEGDD